MTIMRYLYIFLVAAVITLSGCGKSPPEPSATYAEPTSTPASYEEALPRTIEAATSAKEAIAIFENQLPLLDADGVDTMFMALEAFYRADSEKMEASIRDANDEGVFELFQNPVDDAQIATIADEGLRSVVKGAIEGKYKFNAGEGVLEPIVDYRALQAYSGYLSPAMVDYVSLMATESDEPSLADGSIVIPWEQLGERALKAENYLLEHSDSPRFDLAKSVLYRNLLGFLNGSSNDGVFENRRFAPENAEAFQRIIEAYGNSFTARVTEEYRDEVNRLAKELPAAEESYNDPIYEKITKLLENIEALIDAEFVSRGVESGSAASPSA
ncbi:hypothetical protein ACFPPD_02410 [Cohnella suwonensis]|uniref:Imelysin-like domain-containing protein n=1 Tax=Cohnella suwonensis TaxID=696072 RepID=A0ABW0LRC1_9BACL